METMVENNSQKQWLDGALDEAATHSCARHGGMENTPLPF